MKTGGQGWVQAAPSPWCTITFLLEEGDEQLSHGPTQDLTGRPGHHVMTDTPDPWKAGDSLLSPSSAQNCQHTSPPVTAHLPSSHASPLAMTDPLLNPPSDVLPFTEARLGCPKLSEVSRSNGLTLPNSYVTLPLLHFLLPVEKFCT